MTTYTIKGKPYTEFDINKRCAELMGFEFEIVANSFIVRCDLSFGTVLNTLHEFAQCKTVEDYNTTAINRSDSIYDPCTNPDETWPIFEKVWDELVGVHIYDGDYATKWEVIIKECNCTRLVAACILYIEMNGVGCE